MKQPPIQPAQLPRHVQVHTGIKGRVYNICSRTRRMFRPARLLIVLVLVALTSGRLDAQEFQDQIRAIFSCDFQLSTDKNSDRQPDGWRRRRDRDHPSFVQAEIQARDPSSLKDAKATEAILTKIFNAWQTKRWDPSYIPEVTPPPVATLMDQSLLNLCYRVQMDGGNFELVSPAFPIDPRFDYVITGETSCQGLQHHVATIELHITDRAHNKLQFSTPPFQGTRDWETLRSNQITLPDTETFRGEIRIRVAEQGGSFGKGIVRFDNIRLLRMPTLTIASNSTNNIVQPGTNVEFTCKAAGLSADLTQLELTVTDFDGVVVHRQSKSLLNDSAATELASKLVDSSQRPLLDSNRSRNTSTSFQYRFDQTGLYRVHARLGQSQRSLLVAVIDSEQFAANEFGISLAEIPKSSDLDKTLAILKHCQVGWVKFPIWYDYADSTVAKTTLRLAKSLKNYGIKTVGRLDRPPKSQAIHFEEDPSRTQSVVHLQDQRIWTPLLEPIFTEINSFVDCVQLGIDQDYGFMVNQSATAVVENVRSIMRYYFQDPKIAVAWNWLESLPLDSNVDVSNVTWNALQLTSENQLTAAELKSYSAEIPTQSSFKCWATLNPLSASNYSLHDRVVDLLERMIVVKESSIQAAFVDNLFDAEQGLFDMQGQLTEIFVPWVQTASAIGPRRSIGSVELPSGSRNVTFQGSERDVMIVWNPRPVTEELYLGNNVRAHDIWARPVPIESSQKADGSIVQRINVGTWPVFIYGVDSKVIRWRQEFQVLVDYMASHLSGFSDLPIRVQNTLERRVRGEIALHSPTLLKNAMTTKAIDLEANRNEKLILPLELRSDASAGEHTLDFVFHLKADKEYHFSLRRMVHLGHRDIEFLWDLLRVDDQTVEARVEVINRTANPVDFECTFFPPEQTYLRVPMSNCGVGSTIALHKLRIPLPAQAMQSGTPLQSIWIRCEQIRSPLTLNYLVKEKKTNQDGEEETAELAPLK